MCVRAMVVVNFLAFSQTGMSDPQSQSKLFLGEAFDLISNTTILGVLYGFILTIYCLCARLLYLQLWEPDKRWHASCTLVYTSLLLLCTTTMLALNVQSCQSAFINHTDSPGGPMEYTSLTSRGIGIIHLTIEVLTMAIQIWRLWIVWSGTQYALAVIVLPLLLSFTYLGLTAVIGIRTGGFLSYKFSPSTSSKGFSTSGGFSTFSTADYAVLSTFTILVTGLVTVRLLLVRRRNTKIMGTSGTSSPYMSIIAMLIESYALDSIWSIGAAISAGMSAPSVFLFVDNDPAIKVIAYLLVIYRVVVGRGWTKETEHKLTSLQWNRGAHMATDETSGIQSRIPAITTVVVMGSPPISHPGSSIV